MGFRVNSYATVWEVKPGTGNFTKVRLSTNRKYGDGQYEQDFSGYCYFMGDAYFKSMKLKRRDRIKLTEIDVCNSYNSAEHREYNYFKVFNFEEAEPRRTQNAPNNEVEETFDFEREEMEDGE